MKKFFLVAAFVLCNATQALGQDAPSATETEATTLLAQVQDMRMNILPSNQGDGSSVTKKLETIAVVDMRFADWRKESYKIYDFSLVLHERWEPRVVFRDYRSRVPGRAEREVTFGVGYRLINKDKFVLTQDGLISHAWNGHERVTFLQPTTRAFFPVGSRVTFDFAAFPYIPLIGHGNLQWVLERSRATFKVNQLLTLAGGWGATELPGVWQHGTSWGATFTPLHGKLGSFELAYQSGLQFHYTMTGAPHLRHKKK